MPSVIYPDNKQRTETRGDNPTTLFTYQVRYMNHMAAQQSLLKCPIE